MQTMVLRSAQATTECHFTARGTTVEEVMLQLAAHATEMHGIMGWPPEMSGHIMRHVRTVSQA